MLKGIKIGMTNNKELKEQNTKFKGIMRDLGIEKFRLKGILKRLTGAFDIRETDTVTTLDFIREQMININNSTVTVYEATTEQYRALREIIDDSDYIVLNLSTRKVMMRTKSIKEIMLVADEILIVFK